MRVLGWRSTSLYVTVSNMCFRTDDVSYIVLKVPYYAYFSAAYIYFVWLLEDVYVLYFSNNTLFLPCRPLLQHLYSPSLWTLCYSSCLFKSPPFLKSLVCSDWSAVTGLSRHRPLYILVSSVGAFFNDILLRGTADSTFVTSKPYEKSWQLVLWVQTVCITLWIEYFDTLTVFM